VKCFEIAQNACKETADNYLWALGVRARKLFELGIDKREEAFKAWRELIDSAKSVYDIFSDIDINIKWLYSSSRKN
jgi:hypothetical protein